MYPSWLRFFQSFLAGFGCWVLLHFPIFAVLVLGLLYICFAVELVKRQAKRKAKTGKQSGDRHSRNSDASSKI